MTTLALILVDIQNDYVPSFTDAKMPLPGMDAALDRAARLLTAARQAGLKIVHVKHVMASDAAPFFHPGTLGAEIHDSVAPLAGERVVEKAKANSFIGTGLEALLKDDGITHLIVCGAMSQMCIDATVRGGADLGFQVTVADDACAAAAVVHDDISVPAQSVHAAIMAPLAASYAELCKTADLIHRIAS